MGAGNSGGPTSFATPEDRENLLAQLHIEQVERDQERIWPEAPELPGIDFNRDGHQRFLASPFARFIGDYDEFIASPGDGHGPRFHEPNPTFAGLDARVLYVLLRDLRPGRMVAIGAGHGPLLAADVNRRYLAGALDLPPAVAPAERLAALARMILALPAEAGGVRGAYRAWQLARELARLMD